jgi:hypothetical protein
MVSLDDIATQDEDGKWAMVCEGPMPTPKEILVFLNALGAFHSDILEELGVDNYAIEDIHKVLNGLS